MNRKFFIAVIVFSLAFHASAQEKPAYWNDIQAFKKQDSLKSPRPNSILFIGSSSFTMWKDVQQYFHHNRSPPAWAYMAE